MHNFGSNVTVVLTIFLPNDGDYRGDAENMNPEGILEAQREEK